MSPFCPKCHSLMHPKDGVFVCTRCYPLSEKVSNVYKTVKQQTPLSATANSGYNSEWYREYWDCDDLEFKQIDPEREKMKEQFPCIYYLDRYYPWKEVKNNQCPEIYKLVTKRILDLKKEYRLPMGYYARQLNMLLSGWVKGRFHICVIPSHEQFKSTQHIWNLLRLSYLPHNYILDDVIVRMITIEQKHIGSGRRTAHIDYNSMAVDNIVKGDSYLIMDDITTSGSSMVAAASLLKESGAAQIACLALGKTHHLTENSILDMYPDIDSDLL